PIAFAFFSFFDEESAVDESLVELSAVLSLPDDSELLLLSAAELLEADEELPSLSDDELF
ncbi:MAG: hypothetical protein II574_02375, partial [Ruminococcus sp.]|nr:hypothetical protein [Ruminococcus sp.]